MEYSTLGDSGLVVSPLVLGMMSYGNTSRGPGTSTLTARGRSCGARSRAG